MKPTLFGQAFQISELRQQIAELQAQNAKLVTEVKVLRESDRALFDAQEAMIDALKSLVKEFVAFVVKWNWEPGEEAQKRRELVALAQGILGKKEQ